MSHSKPYTKIGNNHDKCLDIVIVVNQLLTGYDSQYANVQVDDIDENIKTLNRTYKNICDIFAIDHIDHFEQLPRSDENRQKFRREFYRLKSTLRTAIEVFTANFGIDADIFYDLYVHTMGGKVDAIKLEVIEKSADINKVKEYFDAKNMLSAGGKLHAELKRFIEEQKAESD